MTWVSPNKNSWTLLDPIAQHGAYTDKHRFMGEATLREKANITMKTKTLSAKWDMDTLNNKNAK